MNHRARKKRIGRWTLVALLVLVCLSFILIHSRHSFHSVPEKNTQVATPEKKKIVEQLAWKKVKVHPSDNLYKIFKENNMSYAALKKIMTLPAAKKHLSHLHPGQLFFLQNDSEKNKLTIKFPINTQETLYLNLENGKPNSHIEKKPIEKHVLYKSATINHSFADTAREAGLTHTQIYQISKIFEGNINFSRDIRPGDHFSLLYSEYYKHGKKEKPGNILAATFTNQGKTYKALYFSYPRNHNGYFTPMGRGVEPLFTMHPVKYKRISSYFTLHRYDPVLHMIHPHLGVDFAAPYGRPIHSIGNGKVIYHGWKGGYGKSVIVRYSKKYKALYGHMSRYASHLKNGDTVKKGQVLGYIGSTGWATGPHLHFEMYVYGIPRNPLKMKFIGGKSIPKSYLPAFYEKADSVLAELKLYQGQEFAMIDEKK